MTQSNHPARQQGTTISKKLHYTDFQQVRDVCHQLRERGVFKHASPADVDERGSFVVITYVDPTVVSARTASAPSAAVARVQPRQLAIAQRPAPVTRPFYQRWQFGLGVIVGVVGLVLGAVYWVIQQLKQIEASEVGAGVMGFLFVAWLAWLIMKSLFGGGGGKGHGGGYGFHYGPCD